MGLFDKLLNKPEKSMQFEEKTIDYGTQQTNYQQTGDPLEDYLNSVIRPINASAEQRRTAEELKKQGYGKSVEHGWSNDDFVASIKKTSGYGSDIVVRNDNDTLPEYLKGHRDYDGDGIPDCWEEHSWER